MILWAILFVLGLAIFAMLWLESLWSNAITLINVTLASLLALNFFEPLASWLDGMLPSFTYLWDYISLWLCFCIFFGILRLLTDIASRTRVKFRPPIEFPGRIISAILVASAMVAFVVTSLHVAPLPAAPFGGSFGRSPTQSTFLFMKPDHYLLNLMQSTSRGSLSRGPIDGVAPSPHAEDADRNVFDPKSEFIVKYRQRRKNLEPVGALRVDR